MPNWPSIANPSKGFDEEYYLPQAKSEFEANYVQTRKIATRGRHQFALVWNQMSETDYQTLKTFFDTNQGSSFTWTHPISGTSYTCVFSGDSIKSKPGVYPGYRTNVSCPIEEL